MGKSSKSATIFKGRMVMLGCGSVGQTVLPLLGNHLPGIYNNLTVLAANESGRGVTERYGADFMHCRLTPGNFQATLKKYLRAGDILLNLSIDVSSIDLIRFCATTGVLYVDSSIEPWPNIFNNPTLDILQRTNYLIRKELLAVAEELGADGPTAVVDHGANPGMVTHFVKQALLDINHKINRCTAVPTTQEEWAALARALNISAIYISERDTQASHQPKRQGEFVNTWSISGFIDELMQPVELALGTFEKRRPKGAVEHEPGCGSIFLPRPGASSFARSWVPSIGSFQGLLVPHDEVFSIADYLSVRGGDGKFVYRPSVMFIYHPCDDAMLSALELEGNGWAKQLRYRLLTKDIIEGMDELGVLLVGHEHNAYWYGSQLDIDTAHSFVPDANATTLQVASGVLSAMMWAIKHPRRGVVEPEALDHAECLETVAPYLGKMTGAYTEWTPLDGRDSYFPERLDGKSPWQLQNVRSRQWVGE